VAVQVLVGDILRVSIVTKLVDQYSWNNIHYVPSELAGVVTDEQVALKYEAAVAPNIVPLLCGSDWFWGIQVQLYRGATQYSTVISNDLQQEGTADDPRLPPQCACIMSGETGLAGRDQVARIFFPLAPTTTMDPNGRINDASIGAYSTLCDEIYSPMAIDAGGGNTLQLNPVIFTRGTGTTKVINFNHVGRNVSQHKTRSLVRAGDGPPF